MPSPSPDPLGDHPTPRALAEGLVRGFAAGEAPRALLDPACGTGGLLLAAWRASGEDPRVAEGLHGIEVHPGRLAAARRRLRAALGGELGRRAAARLRPGDALDPDRPWPRGTWVVANPPWISLSGRQARSDARRRLAPFAEAYSSLAGWPALHAAFLERIARHVAAEGSGARVLLPRSVLALEGYAELRRQVTARCRVVGVRDLGEGCFPGVTEAAAEVELAPAPGPGSRAPWTPAEPAWARHLATFPRLPPECFGDIGVHTGNAARELLLPVGAGPGLREGRDLAPYRLGLPRRSLRTDLPAGAGLRFRLPDLARHRAVPVLLRQTADRPIAALHTRPTFFRNSLLACWPPAELDPAFVVAVLNSRVAAAWHGRFQDARQRTFPQVKVGHLRTQPFPIRRAAEAPRWHDRVVRMARSLAGREDPGLVSRLERLVGEGFGEDPRSPWSRSAECARIPGSVDTGSESVGPSCA